MEVTLGDTFIDVNIFYDIGIFYYLVIFIEAATHKTYNSTP